MPVIRHAVAFALWVFYLWKTNTPFDDRASVCFFIVATCIATSRPAEVCGDKIKQGLGLGKLDPRDWYFDESTGEHYPISIANADGRLYDVETYSERKASKIRARDFVSLAQWATFFTGAFCIYCCMNSRHNAGLYLLGYFSIWLYLGWLYCSIHNQCKYDGITLGPAPEEPASERLIRQQKGHGETHWMTPEEASMAGGGAHAAASIDDYRFPD